MLGVGRFAIGSLHTFSWWVMREVPMGVRCMSGDVCLSFYLESNHICTAKQILWHSVL